VHSVEMQIHADLKGKVAWDDITLWANRCMKCHRNTISRFLFDSALCKLGWNCHRNYTPAGIFFYLQATTLTLTLPLILTLHLLNPKSVGFDRLLRTTTLPSFKSFR